MSDIYWSGFVLWVADRYHTSPSAWGMRDVAPMIQNEREAEIAVRVGVTSNPRGIAALKEMWLAETGKNSR